MAHLCRESHVHTPLVEDHFHKPTRSMIMFKTSYSIETYSQESSSLIKMKLLFLRMKEGY